MGSAKPWYIHAFLLLGFASLCQCANVTSPNLARLQALKKKFEDFEKSTTDTIKTLSRQMMLQQLFVEERIRSDGDSGIKQARVSGGGTKSYHSNAYSSAGVASIHDHSNYERTVGLGEIAAVLNGVDFRTHHNDYDLKMPSRTSSDDEALDDIPFPSVPPSVLQQSTVSKQIAEMRRYFRAFKAQNFHLRDYRPYFKPVMCYLEGAWTTKTDIPKNTVENDRHTIDASSWEDLQEKIQYTSYSGSKNPDENLAWLPRTIINVTEDGTPVYAQWKYRIACHPITTNLGLSQFNPVDDLAQRLRHRQNFTAYLHDRSARYYVSPSPGCCYGYLGYGMMHPRPYAFGKLDQIMSEIPGKDGYNANITDDSFDLMNYRVDTKNLTVLNTARYHRWYRVSTRGAMGLNTRRRGFADDNMWTAKTTNPKVANVGLYHCYRHKTTHKQICKFFEGRYTYAIPLEVIWLTPLSTWNPYNLTLHDRNHAHQVTDGGRDGSLTDVHKAYKGVGFNNYYLTPTEFYDQGLSGRHPGSLPIQNFGVLDQTGKIKQVSPSGIQILTPDIPGTGKVRLRFPIMPVHQDGSSAWKNLEALQDSMMDMWRNTYIFEKRPEFKDYDARKNTKYVTSVTNTPTMHQHEMHVTQEQVIALQHAGTTVNVYTSQNHGHHHELELQLVHGNNTVLKVVKCDGKPHCWDHHQDLVFKQH